MRAYQLPSAERIRLARISHVTYQHRDAAAACRFAEDFGFFECARSGPRTFFRGYGTEPFVLCIEQLAGDVNPSVGTGSGAGTGTDKKGDAPAAGTFGGGAFAVESVEELERARRVLEPHVRVSEVYDLAERLGAPGGGKAFTFWDPVNADVPVRLVAGQEMVEVMDPKLPLLKMNYPMEKNRGANEFQRVQKRPAPVHKLGHFGLCVTDFARCFDFWSTFFNLFPSDLVYDEAGVDKTVFFRLDRGAELVDHHCFFFFEGKRSHVHHSSFETHDFDTQVLGHDWLREKGWRPCWGVGRHVMGSQIFDYWFDPADFIMEHYVDGDLLDISEPTHRIKASPDNLYVWGPEVPAVFMD